MIAVLFELVAPLWPLILGAVGILAALFAGRAQGRAKAERDAAFKQLTEYRATRKAVDDETVATDPGDARKRLHDRAAGKP